VERSGKLHDARLVKYGKKRTSDRLKVVGFRNGGRFDHGGSVFFDEYASTFDAQTAFREQPDRPGIDLVLGLKDPIGQDLRGVIRFHAYDFLQDDRTGVVFLVDEMNRRSGPANAVVNDRLMNAHPVKSLSAEGREQGWVDIHNPIPIRVDDHGRDLAHVAGKRHQVDLMVAQKRNEIFGLFIAGEYMHRYIQSLGSSDNAGPGVGRDTQCHSRPERVVATRIRDRLEIGSASGCEDGCSGLGRVQRASTTCSSSLSDARSEDTSSRARTPTGIADLTGK